MKRVAIVGSDFAPSSYPPALRIRFFAQHLREFGYDPIIITVQPKYYAWAIDEDNNRLLPDWMTVIRTAALEEKYTRRFGLGDIGIRSFGRHWRTLVRLCRQGRIDLLYISVPSYVPMVLGRLIHEQFGIPYVVDYQDPWVTEYYWRVPKTQRPPPKWPLVYAMARTLEPVALKKVSLIAGVSEGTINSVTERYDWLFEVDRVVAPLGGEPNDFEFLRNNPRANSIFDKNDGLLHLSYVGVIPVSMQLTLRALLDAVRMGVQEAPELFGRLRLHFVGTTYAANSDGLYQVLPLADEIGVRDNVDEHPARVPYLDALQLMLDSHGLLAIGSDEPHYTASKIFPNILARRPLLAIFHEESTVVDIVRATQAGEVVTFNTQFPASNCTDKIYESLHRVLSLPHDYLPPTNWEAFEPFTARSTAMKLADAFDRILSSVPL